MVVSAIFIMVNSIPKVIGASPGLTTVKELGWFGATKGGIDEGIFTNK